MGIYMGSMNPHGNSHGANLNGANTGQLSPVRMEPETRGSSMCAADLLLLPYSSAGGSSPSTLSAMHLPCVTRNAGGEDGTLQLAGWQSQLTMYPGQQVRQTVKKIILVLLHSHVPSLQAQGHIACWVTYSTSYPTSQPCCVIHAKKSLQFP